MMQVSIDCVSNVTCGGQELLKDWTRQTYRLSGGGCGMLLAALVCAGATTNPLGAASEPRTGAQDIIQQLLDVDPKFRTRDWIAQQEERNQTASPEMRWLPGEPPPAAAPAEIHLGFWKWLSETREDDERDAARRAVRPSEEVRRLLLDVCVERGRSPRGLVWYFPTDPESVRRVERLHATMAHEEDPDRDMEEWLLLHSESMWPQLVEAVEHTEFNWQGTEWRTRLEAFASRDWKRAENTLRRFARGKEPQVAAVALAALYRRACGIGDGPEAARLRETMLRIVEDSRGSAYARDCLCRTLFATEWAGCEPAFARLFSDRTLTPLFEPPEEGWGRRCPLEEVARANPEKWIPVVTRLLGSGDATIRRNAAWCLVGVGGERGRADAARPLLAWLGGAGGFGEEEDREIRHAVLDLLSVADLPESVPALTEVMKKEDVEVVRRAARAAARQRDHAVIPALHAALGRLCDPETVREIGAALLACGCPEREIVARLRTCFASSHERNAWADAVGPKLAERLNAAWVLSMFVKEPRLDVGLMRDALCARGGTVREFSAELLETAARGGMVGAFAAIMAGDAAIVRGYLESQDVDTAMMAFACARVARRELPLPVVERILKGTDQRRAAAACGYLIDNDGADARRIVRAHGTGRGRIVGYDGGLEEHLGVIERKFVEGMGASNGAIEVYALVCVDSDAMSVLVARVYAGHVTTDGSPECYAGYLEGETRLLPPERLSRFRAFAEERRVDELAPLIKQVFDAPEYVYLHLTREGGVRVYMQDPSCADVCGSTHNLLRWEFLRLVL